jgi:hypothetical protein
MKLLLSTSLSLFALVLAIAISGTERAHAQFIDDIT